MKKFKCAISKNNCTTILKIPRAKYPKRLKNVNKLRIRGRHYKLDIPLKNIDVVFWEQVIRSLYMESHKDWVCYGFIILWANQSGNMDGWWEQLFKEWKLALKAQSCYKVVDLPDQNLYSRRLKYLYRSRRYFILFRIQ